MLGMVLGGDGPTAGCASKRLSTRRLAVLALFLIGGAGWMAAQTGGEGALEGTVTDPTGAVVPNATVSATNQASNVSTTRSSSSAGLYEITPLIPGVYTVTVTAPGFTVEVSVPDGREIHLNVTERQPAEAK